MRISFLLHSIDNFGGVPRATSSLASALAVHHEVEIVSIFRTADRPSFAPSADVTVRYLSDQRDGAPKTKNGKPSRIMPREDGWADRYTQETDDLILGHLGSCSADVVIVARPALAAYLIAHGRHGYGRVVIDHESSMVPSPELRERTLELYREMDGVVCLTQADLENYRRQLGEQAPPFAAIGNIVPPPARHAPVRGLPLIAAAGRLVPLKGFDTLINAFAMVAPHHPQWRLRIYGRGPEQARLQDLVHAHGLSDAVRLMGALPDLTAEWDKAAFAVSAARRESFGLTLVEAMHHGLPVLAADAPFGPGEIVVPGRNGILVPVGDEEAMAQAMRYLIEQPGVREQLSEGAYASAPLYSAERIAFRYDAFLRDVAASVPKERTAAVPPAAPSGVPAEVLVRGDGAIEVRAVLEPGTEPPALCVTLRKAESPLVRLAALGTSVDEVTGALRSVYAVPAEPAVLAEGRYDIDLELPDGRRRPLAVEGVHTGGLLVRRVPAEGPAYWPVPYRTADGHLSVFVRHRVEHAEVHAVLVGQDGWLVRGNLIAPPGTDLSALRLGAVPRRGSAGATIAGQVSMGYDGAFEAHLPFAGVVAASSGGHDDWDLWLEREPGQPRIRLARFFDDLLERKRIDVYPTQRWHHPTQGPARGRVFYTPGNELSFTVSPDKG
ncbi:glycosyltransferase family 4 protein [Streptomyces sp. A1277]|uniref:glycosyltransferase n=1 Tax=Streptomyces sp. A1277 TaxID=2563103 RepID=UPI0010A29B4B|nr:glycosyltransferase [Streptomyces sp. A1277]THA32758.1 glycosyltransferase family 4 protein [Streptomyces sp. A1277]